MIPVSQHDEYQKREREYQKIFNNIEKNNVTKNSTDSVALQRRKEVKALLRRQIPVAQRVVGDNDELTLKMSWIYAHSLYRDEGAPLDDLREAVTTLDDSARIARRVLGGQHPLTMGIEHNLQDARAALRARETQSPPSSA